VAWNTPGGSGDKDPWGSRRKGGTGAPDIDEIVRKIQRALGGLFGGRGGGGDGGLGGGRAPRIGVGVIVGAAVLLWLATGFYIIQQGERGVVLRFGKLQQVTTTGLSWRFPYPFESVEKVNTEKITSIEIGYRSSARGAAKVKVPKEALMLTEDENIIDIEFAVQYKISDPAAYLFNVRDVEGTIAQATESAVREVIGKTTLDFALTEGRDAVSRTAKQVLQEILDRYSAGIQIVALETQKAQPPEEVKAAFDDAVKAREDEQRFINEAQAYANDVIPRARGAAARAVQEAEGYKASVTARAEGDARRFSAIAVEYAKAPRVTRERLYLETLEQVFAGTSKVFVDQKGGNNVLYLPLDRMIPQVTGHDGAPSPTAPSASPEPAGGPAARPDASTRSRTNLRSRGAE